MTFKKFYRNLCDNCDKCQRGMSWTQSGQSQSAKNFATLCDNCVAKFANFPKNCRRVSQLSQSFAESVW